LKHPVERSAYHLAGLRLLSEFRFSGLVPWDERFSALGQIAIVRTELPESLGPAAAKFPDGECTEKEMLLNIPEVGRFLLRGGDEILVDLAPEMNDEDIRAYLLGTIFGILCHQRGIVPLHAASIDIEGGCVAFVGDSGAGKSTLIAALAARGHQVISDDVCFLQFSDHGNANVWPGVGRIRLWEDALHALCLDSPGVTRETTGYNKFLVPILQPPNPSQPRRLQRIYELEAAPDGEGPGITRVQGAAAIEILLRNIYRLEYAEYMGRKSAIFEFCARMARQVSVFRFRRPMGFDVLQSGMDVLVADTNNV
jgi:energy-coupling factor transporter ATP-binding protein EcfA2